MALTAEQIAFRSKHIGGSDANIIMGGDADKILHLWKLKRGETQDEDLSDVIQVQMGIFTEPFNKSWFERKTGRIVTNCGDQLESEEYSFMGCTLDGLTDGGTTVWEAKHVSAFSNSDEILERYYPQLHHNMIVCGLERAVLSVIFGNHKWDALNIEKDPVYAAMLAHKVEHFWDCVKTGKPPVAEAVKASINPVRRVDMTFNNMWAVASEAYKQNADAKNAFDKAAKDLKSLVDEDVAEAYGHGVIIKRDKAGSLRIKVG